MKMTGEERIEAPRNRVWEALNDPQVLQQCIPGCQSLEQEAADRLRAVVEIKIGPIGARFNSTISLTDVQPQERYTLVAEGQGGTVGFAKGSIQVRLTEQDSATLLSYEVDAQVGGRLAQLGGPIIDATAKQFASRFFKRFSELMSGTEAVPQATAAAAKPVAGKPVVPAQAPAAASGAFPIAWILALVVALLAGFLIGRGSSEAGVSDWMGLAIGLLIVIVAAAAFEFGRRTAPQVVLDAQLLRRLQREEQP